MWRCCWKWLRSEGDKSRVMHVTKLPLALALSVWRLGCQGAMSACGS